ncbi:MAG: DUF488 domain-containing protein [Anaerolineaceae bacterium]|jgi:uncharacterized protein YeaO (DUF488 family)|nr:DUF488 domain-containing protein [Anaerolineaceae bacterium]MDD4577670.1 DUF488 domain-containing protein [Anaerolineaceae bacterium]
MPFKIKRIYEDYEPTDGWRVLVDRIWPRGVSKEEARLDAWSKELAPSTELRKWFGHIPEKYNEFRKRYYKELDNNPEAQRLLTDLRSKSKDNVVTLLYSAKDTERNQAVVLLEYLEKK